MMLRLILVAIDASLLKPRVSFDEATKKDEIARIISRAHGRTLERWEIVSLRSVKIMWEEGQWSERNIL